MLFFKQIKDGKLSDPCFESFYKKECHICSLTTTLISMLDRKNDLSEILSTLRIPEKDYALLKSGDRCDPEQVARLCRYLGVDSPPRAGTCPRLPDKPS